MSNNSLFLRYGQKLNYFILRKIVKMAFPDVGIFTARWKIMTIGESLTLLDTFRFYETIFFDTKEHRFVSLKVAIWNTTDGLLVTWL